MKTSFIIRALSLCFVLTICIGRPVSAAVDMTVPSGDYPKQIGDKTIKDPSDTSHSKAEIKGKVVVVIFSIPNMTHGDIQEKWAKVLAEDPATKVSDKVGLYLVEDMSQAGWTSGMARSSMKKEFTKGSRPILILDEKGDFTKRFGIPKSTTCILIYDKKSTLRDVENNMKDVDTTDSRVKDITKQLQAE